jgi:hypothetical protein
MLESSTIASLLYDLGFTLHQLKKLTYSQHNILVSPDGIPCITGFGSSFIISRPDLWSERDDVAFHRGSAPELLLSPKPGEPAVQVTKESDMYAFGMLTWEVETPYPSRSSITSSSSPAT